MNTVVRVGSSPSLRIAHCDRRELTSQESAGILIESLEENDTLTEVTIGAPPAESIVRVHWNPGSSPEFGALYVPESDHLFLGAGQVSGTVNLQDGSVVSTEYPFLFWSFELRGRFVLQFGELECLLHDLKGNVLGRATVDPPYDVSYSSEGAEFKSIVAGRTTLEFPAES